MKVITKESDICHDSHIPKLLDAYDEDEVQIEFLRKPPTSFLILGKPFTGKTTLAKKLAAEWNCPIISPMLLVQDAISTGSDIGIECQQTLERGEKVTDSVVFELLEEAMANPELNNLGYVLDGFPTLSEKFKSYSEQLDYILNLPVTPNFSIRLKMSDHDVIKRKTQARYSTFSGLIHLHQEYTPPQIKPKFKTFDEEEAEKRRRYSHGTEEDEDEDEITGGSELLITNVAEPPEFILLPLSVIKTLVTPPEHMEDRVKADLNLYHRKVPLLEAYTAKFGRQCSIELDANLPPGKLFEGLLTCLKKMMIPHPVLPVKMAFSVESDLEALDDAPLEGVLNILSKGSMVAPYFRWRASRWLKRCPVELFAGNIKNGRPVYSVGYCDTVYFMSSKEHCNTFFENPRLYLLPPMPQHPCKFVVFGHPRTGRTCLCYALADQYKGKVIDFGGMISAYKKAQLCNKLQHVWVETTCTAIEEIQFQEVLDAAVEAEASRINELIITAKEAAIADAKQKIEKTGTTSAKTVTTTTTGVKTTTSATVTPLEEYYPYGDQNLPSVKLPKGMTGQDFEDMLPTADELVRLALSQLAEEGPIREESLGIRIVGDNDEVVAAKVDEAMREAEEEGVEMPVLSQLALLVKALEDLENERTENRTKWSRSGGWVLDNFPTDPDLLQSVFDEGIIPSCVIVLKDPTLEHDIVFKRWLDTEGKRDYFGQLKPPTCVAEPEASAEMEEHVQERADDGHLDQPSVMTSITGLRASGQQSGEALEQVSQLASGQRSRSVSGHPSGHASGQPSALTSGEQSMLTLLPPAGEPREPSPGETDQEAATVDGPSEVGANHLDLESEVEEVLPPPKDEKQIAYELKVEAYRTSLAQMTQFFEVVPYLLPKDNTIDFLKVEISSKAAEIEEEGEEELEPEEAEEDLIKEEETGLHLRGTASDFSKDEEELGVKPKTYEEIRSEVLFGLQSIFMKQPREVTSADKEADDEDFSHNVFILRNISDAEDVQKEKLRQFGDTSYFCPVKLKESWVLHPGQKSIEAKYKDKLYRFSSNEALKKFLQNAHDYVSHKTPMKVPPVRICILGPRGSGKSIHARVLAKELNLFHIDFCERLQEVILPKTCRRLGFPYQVDQEQMDIDDAEMLAESVVESLFSSPAGSEEEESTVPEGSRQPSAGTSVPGEYEEVEEVEEETLEAGDEATTSITRVGSIHESEDSANDLDESEEEFEEGMITPTTGTKSLHKELSAFEEEEEEEYEDEGIEEEETDAMHRLFSSRELQIKDYLQRGTPLSSAILEELVMPWWTQEPYKSTGFVLEGFPNNRSEVEFMGSKGLTPDAVVFLRVDDLDVIQRFHSLCMEKWQKLLEYKRIKKAEAKRIAQLKREAAIGARRRALVEQKQRKQHVVQSFKSSTASHFAEEENYMEEEEADVEDEEEESSIDIEAIIAEEFPEIEDIPEEEETSEDAQLRFHNMLLHIFQNDEDKLNTVKDVLDNLQVPCHTINAKRKPDKVTFSCLAAVGSIAVNRGSLLEKGYAIAFPLAEKLLQSGYKMPSKFGWWCPVLLASCVVTAPYYGSNWLPFPALHRSHIYYMSSENARQKFLTNPVKYIQQAEPNPDVPLTISVVGPPKTGKTTLARRFTKEHGMVRLSSGDAIRYVLEKLPECVLADELSAHLEAGSAIPTEMVISSLKAAMMETRAQLYGVVLDGIPVTGNQVEKMVMKDLIPFYIIELRQLLSHSLERNRYERDQYHRLYAYPDDDEIVEVRFQAVVENITAARSYFELEHHNWVTLDSSHSKWWVWVNASAQFLKIVNSVQKYLVETTHERAVGVYHLCIAPHEFQANLDPAFRNFCPVSLAVDDELVDCSNMRDLEFAAEYKGKYYSTCSSEHLELFIADPTIFLPPLAPRDLPPPELLPHKFTIAQAREIHHKYVEFGGYCPVSFVEGYQLYESLVPGYTEAAVKYCHRVYFCSNEAMREKFMRKPVKYINLKLPFKRPPRRQPANILSLPLLGYLEQTVAAMLIKALIVVGNVKPKYPFLDSTRSAVMFLAYYLKANNPKQSAYCQEKYNKKIIEFKERCQLLKYLTKHATRLPFPKGRRKPADYDDKMEEFFSLKLPPEWHILTPRLPHILEL